MTKTIIKPIFYYFPFDYDFNTQMLIQKLEQMATLDLHGVNSKDDFVNMVGEAVRCKFSYFIFKTKYLHTFFGMHMPHISPLLFPICQSF